MSTFNGGPSLVTRGLVLYLDAANTRSYPGTGTTWTDLSSNSNGTLIGNVTYNTTIGGNVPGLLCTGTGAGGAIIVPHVPSHLNTTVTFSCWFWMDTTFTADRVWVIKGNSNANPVGTFYLYEQTTSNAQVLYNQNVPSAKYNLSNTLTNNGRWNNIGITYDGSNVITYYNGIQVGISPLVTTITSTLALCINGDYNYIPGSLFYPGSTKKYNQISMYNRALSAVEIQQNYDVMKSRFGL